MKALQAILRREVRLVYRQGVDSAMVLAFFLIAVALFPFGIGPEPNLLARIAPGVIWVAALLAAMLSMERLFQSDYEDGSLELLVLAPAPLELTVLGKVLVHWLSTGLPLIIAAPMLAMMMHLPTDAVGVLLGSLALGTPALSLIGAVGAALVLGARRGGVLLSLLVLPLFIPVLIFAVGAVDAAAAGLPVKAQLLILGAFSLGALLAGWIAHLLFRRK